MCCCHHDNPLKAKIHTGCHVTLASIHLVSPHLFALFMTALVQFMNDEWFITSPNAALIFLSWEEVHAVHRYCVFCSISRSNIQVHIIKLGTEQINYININELIKLTRKNSGQVLTVLQDRGSSWIHMLEAQWCCSCSGHCGNQKLVRNKVKSIMESFLILAFRIFIGRHYILLI